MEDDGEWCEVKKPQKTPNKPPPSRGGRGGGGGGGRRGDRAGGGAGGGARGGGRGSGRGGGNGDGYRDGQYRRDGNTRRPPPASHPPAGPSGTQTPPQQPQPHTSLRPPQQQQPTPPPQQPQHRAPHQPQQPPPRQATAAPPHQSTPQQHQPTPPQHQSTPPQHQPTPPQHQSTSPQHQPTPPQHQPTPPQHQPTPSLQSTPPSHPLSAPSAAAPSAGKSWAAIARRVGPVEEEGECENKEEQVATKPSFSWSKHTDTPEPKTTLYGFDFGPLMAIALSTPPTALQPRGLHNPGNLCFMNVILQSLLGCPSFFRFLSVLHETAEIPRECPMLHNLTLFASEFVDGCELFCKKKGNVKNADLAVGDPFTATSFYECIDHFALVASSSAHGQLSQVSTASPLAAVKGTKTRRQEDAQEFLSYVIDTLHEELCSVSMVEHETTNVHNTADDGDDVWQEVGARSQAMVVRAKVGTRSSPISSLFCGNFRSVLKKGSAKGSMSFEPFHCINLDIKGAGTVTLHDALSQFFSPESLHDYTDQRTQREVAASKQMTIDRLPSVLLLHFKRFAYVNSPAGWSLQKIHKHVEFDESLVFAPHFLSGDALGAKKQDRTYSLFSVVCHHGNNVGSGHYTCYVKHGSGVWLHYDDNVILVANVNEVLSSCAYLLFYQ